jgi:hypothetical protein
MGSPIGTFDDYEIGDLTPNECAQLREEIIKQFTASEDIRTILRSKPTVLKPFLDSNPDIRRALRNGVANTFAHRGKLKLINR